LCKKLLVFYRGLRKAPCFSHGDKSSLVSRVDVHRTRWYNVYLKKRSTGLRLCEEMVSLLAAMADAESTSHTTMLACWKSPSERSPTSEASVRIIEDTLRTNQAQRAAIDEAIRTVQFVRNKCLRLWMDGRGIGDNDLQIYCAQLEKRASLCRSSQLAGPSNVGRSGLAFDCPLLQELSREETRQKGLPPFPA
jgi:hypothetical protein